MQTRITRTHLSTSTLAPTDQLSSWGTWVSALHGSFSVHHTMPTDYAGQIAAIRCDGLQIVKFNGQRESLERKRAHVEADGISTFEIVIPLSDSIVISQGGKQATLPPGQFIAVDMAEPSRFEHTKSLTALLFAFSRSDIASRVGRPEKICGRPLQRHPLLAASLAFVSTFAESADVMDDRSFVAGAGHIRDLLAMIMLDNVDTYSCESAVRAATLARIKRLINARLSDTDLDLARIAKDAGISVRYIQSLFQATGTTPQQFIREQRLRRGAEMLANPHKKITITQIAYSAGFSSSSQFACAFRQLFDCTPTEFRRRECSSALQQECTPATEIVRS
ncbi:MAG: helix-turn-helix domain-containing protein [Burkholderiaceae bacterium]|jgi:AraC-like DNA-binding protein